MSRKSRSLRRVSSILKIDKDDETGVLGSKRNSRRVSFAETCQVKEIPRNSPRCYKDASDTENEENQQPNSMGQGAPLSITGLDKLLTGAIQTPYQDIVSSCPDVSMDEFNIFDSNRTILGQVDMDTTAAGGTINLPGDMDFQTEPSSEIRMDHIAFIKSLTDHNGSLKPMQIYSPNREKQASVLSDRMNQSMEGEKRSPLKGLSLQQTTSLYDHNKENIIVHADMVPSYKPTEDAQSLYDVKNFFNNLFAPKSTDGDMEENMDETNCYGGIQQDLYKSGLEKTSPDTTDSVRSNRSEGFQYNDNNVTTVFSGSSGCNGIEETKCIGDILNQSISTRPPQYGDADTTINMTVPMEMTKPVGLSVTSKTADTTLNMTVPMGMTKPVGLNVTSKTADTTLNMTVPMEMTKPVGLGVASKAANTTLNITVPMEMTEPVGLSVASKTADTTLNMTVPMEMTKPVGLSNESTDVAFLKATSVDSAFNVSVRNQTVSMEEANNMSCINISTEIAGDTSIAQDVEDVEMEETGPLPGIIESKPFNSTANNKTLTMEETKMVGGILDKSLVSGSSAPQSRTLIENDTQPLGSQLTSDISKNRTANQTMGMEETVAVGGILNTSAMAPRETNVEEMGQTDQTKNITVCMEETRALGTILKQGEETMDTSNIRVPLSWGDGEKTMCIGEAMEETKPVGGLVKQFGGKQQGETSILERTVTFEKFDADWTASQLKQNRSMTVDTAIKVNTSIIESSIAGSNKLTNITTLEQVSMEETTLNTSSNRSRIGPIQTANQSMSEKHQYKLSQTVTEAQTMEETQCVTGMLQVHTDRPEQEIGKTHTNASETSFTNKPQSNGMPCEEDLIVDEDIVFKKSSYDTTAEMDLTNMTSTTLTNISQDCNTTLGTGNDTTEPLSKAPNKRSYGEIRETGQYIEKTQDLTQSQTQLAKLKEMLINSKKKTAAHLRTGDIKTPSKILQTMSSSSKYTSTLQSSMLTRSPVSKKQRVESEREGLDVSLANISMPLNSPANHSLLNKTVGDSEGIDEEQMPDDMRLLHGTTCSTVVDSPSEHSHTSSDLPSSENKTSSSIHMSLISNKSFASSFNIPEGPLSLETFYSLTFRPPSNINRGRTSTVFSPRIDMDDVEEVLEIQLTTKPQVEHRKALEKSMLEKIVVSKDTKEWLQKTLEETQPQIFHDCSQATAEELQMIRDELRTLSKCCHKNAASAWKQDTAQMISDTLAQIKGESTQKAESILKDIQDTTDSVDKMLISLDAELAGLDETELQLLELQQRQDTLSQQLEASVTDLEEKSKMADKLTGELTQLEEIQVLEKDREEIREQVLAQLLCVDWNLDDYQEDRVVFTFNQDQLELQIDCVPLTKDRAIKHITLRQRPTLDDLTTYEKLCRTMIVCAVDTDSLQQRYTTFVDLPHILSEVSAVVKEITLFCTELDKVGFRHKLSIIKNRVELELWSVETLDLLRLGLTFNERCPMSTPVLSDVQITLGHLQPETVQMKLAAVEPGRRYLSRLIDAIDFTDLHTATVSIAD